MDNWCMLFGLAMILHSRLTQTEFVESVTQKLISSFMNENQINFAVFINCEAPGNDQIKVLSWNVNCEFHVQIIGT